MPADLTEVAAVQKPKTRRVSGDRAVLGVMQKEAYYQSPSLGGGTGVSAMLTGGKAQIDPQSGVPDFQKKGQGRGCRVAGGVRGVEEDKEP